MVKKDPIILLRPADSQAVGANQQLMADALAAIPALAKPGSIEGFEAIHTERKRDLLRLTQELNWQHTFISPSSWDSFAGPEGNLDLPEVLGVTASSTLFCEQNGDYYVVEECNRCGAYCQGFIEEDGCPCCYGDEEPVSNMCDCTEGDGFEPSMRCPLHNLRHDYTDRVRNAKSSDELAWAPTAPPDPFRGMSGASAQQIKGLMSLVAGGEIAERFAVRFAGGGEETDRDSGTAETGQ